MDLFRDMAASDNIQQLLTESTLITSESEGYNTSLMSPDLKVKKATEIEAPRKVRSSPRHTTSVQLLFSTKGFSIEVS